VLLAILENKSI